MPVFEYKALNADGIQVAGSQEASTLHALTNALQEKALYVLNAKPQRLASRSAYKGKVNRCELISFTDQLVIIIRAGIPILTGLQEIAKETRHPGFRQVILDVVDRVSDGQGLSKALEAYPKIFDEAFVSIVSAGEEMGGLDVVLEKLVRQMEWAHETKKQVLGAMVQPTFLLVAVTGLTIMVVTVLVPQITDIFSKAGRDLPGVTQKLVAVSNFIQNYWKVCLTGLGALIAAIIVANRFPTTRIMKDHVKLRIPVIGRVLELFAASRFVNLFAVLYEAGVTVDRNLEIVSKTTGNAVTDQGIVRMRDAIMEGSSVVEGAKIAGVFPSLVIRMLAIGEQSGQIPEALEKVNNYYDRAIPRALKKIITVLQPVLLVLCAGMVAFVVFAAFMPIIKLVSGGH
ncbi:MAG: hypothetical protein CMJ83_09250 [Planctomycetes bacterium]|nr:hypothetical protein [Planctomycetota bacterium]